MFTHHNLKVYDKALALAAGAEELSAPWGRRHAVVEQFRRASESIVLNIAVEMAAQAAVKAAAYLDLYQRKATLIRVETADGKELLSRIIAMLNRF